MEGIEIDVTASLTKENADLMQQIKKLKNDKKALNKEIKLLKNVISRYQEAIDMQMKDSKEIKRGKGIETDI